MTISDTSTAKAPWHLWVVGVIGLLWNLLGGANYYFTQTMGAETLAGLDEVTRNYMEAIPAWFDAAWAIAVWGSVVASVLLLLRKAWAAPLFLVCMLSQLLCVAYAVVNDAYSLPGGTMMIAMSALVFGIALGLWLYARAMAKRGVLS